MKASYQPSRQIAFLALGAVILVAAWLRFTDLATQSVWRDEGVTWFQSSGSFLDVFNRTASDNYPPLHNLLAWVSMKLLGEGEFALRLPAVLASLASVALTYGLGARLGGRFVGLVAATLLALSGFQVWYAQESRAYALLTATSVGFAWVSLYYLDRPGRWSIVAMVLAGLTLVYSHPFGALTWIAIALGSGIVLLLRREPKGLIDLVLVHAIIALGFLPWAVILLIRASYLTTHGFWIKPVDISILTRAFQSLFSQLQLVVLGVLVVGVLHTAWRRRPDTTEWSAIALLTCWAVLPFAVAIAASLLIQPVFVARYLIGCVPAVLILAGMALARFVVGWRSFALASAAVAAAGVYSFAYGLPGPREDWRSAVNYALAQYKDGDCLVVDYHIDTRVLNYYGRTDKKCVLMLNDPKALPRAPRAATLIYVTPGVNMDTVAKLSVDWMERNHTNYHRTSTYVFDPRPAANH